MRPSPLVRSLGTLIPPKIATPNAVTGGSGASLTPLVDFYSKLPKGPAPSPAFRGIKGRFFNGKNASGLPIVAGVLTLFVFGYTIDYHMHLKHHKNHPH